MREAIVTCKSRHWHDGHWVTCALLPGHRGWHSTTRREESRVEVAPGVLITVTAPPGADEADALAYVHDVVARIREAGR